MGNRSLKAPLSPSEELTLRRIALAITSPDEMPATSLTRLRGMKLLDDANRLTPLGRERYASLERPTAKTKGDDAKAALLDALRKVARS